MTLIAEVAEWKVEAKLENNDRYFYHTAEVDQIASGRRCFVVGRKGTGKTAISEFLNRASDYRTFATKLTFKNFPFNDLYALHNERFTPPNQYITLWKYLIYSSVARMMVPNEAIDGVVRTLLSKIYEDDPEQSLPRTISRWTSKDANFSLLGSGLGVGREVQTSTNDTPWVDRVEVLERLIHRHIDNARYLILFDELDEDYKDVVEAERHEYYAALLTSLFKAVQDVRAVFAESRFQILPIVFIRDDIFSTIKDPDKTKWSDLSIELDWNTDKIRQLLAFRLSRAIDPAARALPFATAWRALFSSDRVRYGDGGKKAMDAFDYIARSTLLRPRDFIRYLRVCAERAATFDADRGRDGAVRVSSRTIHVVDKAFSNYMRSEIEDEMHGVLAEISAVLDLIAHIRKQVFSVAEFEDAYCSARIAGRLSERNPEDVLRMLFHFSVLGNQPKQKNTKVFKYLNKEARVNLKELLCVHRGLFKALQIV